MNRYICWILLAATSAAMAQETAPGAVPDPMMDPAIVQMKAQAARPGDEALTCDQLQGEVVATINDPALQSVIQQQGAMAQEQMGKMQQAQAQSEAAQAARPSMAGQIVRGLVTSMIPANPISGYAQMAASAAQNQAQAIEAQKNQEAMMANMEKMMTIMPQLMRAAHLVDIAQAKSCEFMDETME